MQKTGMERHFPWKHLSIQVHQGSGLVAMIGAQVSALVRSAHSTLFSSYPGSPRCYTLNFCMSQALNSPLLAGESIRANFGTKQNRT